MRRMNCVPLGSPSKFAVANFCTLISVLPDASGMRAPCNQAVTRPAKAIATTVVPIVIARSTRTAQCRFGFRRFARGTVAWSVEEVMAPPWWSWPSAWSWSHRCRGAR